MKLSRFRVIARLKRRARTAYEQTNRIGHGGRHIRDVISGGAVSKGEAEFKAIMKRLARIDPTMPDRKRWLQLD